MFNVIDDIRYCASCNYVLLKDLAKLKYRHRESCGVLKAGGDCMCYEYDKTYCECGK